MPNQPDYMTGIDLTSVTIAPGTSSGGVITWGTPVDFSTEIENIDINLASDVRMVKPTNAARQHHIIVSDGFTANFSSLRTRGTGIANNNKILSLFKAADVFKVLSTQSGTVYELHVLRGTAKFGQQGDGEQRLDASFVCIDTGATNFLKVS